MTVKLAAVFSALAVSPAFGQLTVSFPSPDGGTVVADTYGVGRRGVVLAPGGRFRKESWSDQARTLSDAGFRVVAIDYRGRGQSQAGPDASMDDVHLDVQAAVYYLQANGAETIAIIGASFGGEAAGNAVLGLPAGSVDRLVLLAHSAIGPVESLTGRKLFITSRGDTTGTGRHRLDWIQDEFNRSSEPKRLVVVDGAAHAQFLFDTPQGSQVMSEIVAFLLEP